MFLSEKGLTVSICDTSSSPCLHNCYDPGPEVGPIRCSCFKGYQLESDGRNCVDIDECDEKTHNCDLRAEECVNSVGGFQCIRRRERHEERDVDHHCPPGYKWNSRERRCAGMSMMSLCFQTILLLFFILSQKKRKIFIL